MYKGDKVFIKNEIDTCCINGHGNPEPYEILTAYEDIYGGNVYFLSNHREYVEGELIKEDDLIDYIFRVVDMVKSFVYQSLAQNN